MRWACWKQLPLLFLGARQGQQRAPEGQKGLGPREEGFVRYGCGSPQGQHFERPGPEQHCRMLGQGGGRATAHQGDKAAFNGRRAASKLPQVLALLTGLKGNELPMLAPGGGGS